MRIREFLEELAYPASSASTVIALTTFVVLITLAEWAGMFGLWLMVVTIPALFPLHFLPAFPGTNRKIPNRKPPSSACTRWLSAVLDSGRRQGHLQNHIHVAGLLTA